MPNPSVGESREDFMRRCVPMMLEEGNDREGATAACSTMYDESKCLTCSGSGMVTTNVAMGGHSKQTTEVCKICNGTGNRQK